MRFHHLASAFPSSVVALGVLLVAFPFASAHMAWRDLADAHIHLLRIYVIDAALARGDLYPRWLPDLYLGYGYPLLNYYAPGTYYLGSLIHRLGGTIYGTLQALGLLSVILGATGAFLLARAAVIQPAGRNAAAVLAALAYVLAPYPFQTNLYVRAAIPEALALGLLPWLFYACWRCLHAFPRGVAGLTVATAALVLTHNTTALFGLTLLGAWALLVGPTRGLVGAAASAAAGLALSAFFWLPALAEGHLVQLDLLRGGIYDFHPWLFDPLTTFSRVDYPLTRTGPADLHFVYDYSSLDRAVPVKPGLAQLILWSFGLVIGLFVLVRRGLHTARTPLAWAGLGLGCWFLHTTQSAPLWERVPLLSMAQFPWRLYGPGSLAIAAAAGTGLGALCAGASSPTRWASWLLAGLFTLLLTIGALPQRPFLSSQDPPHDVDARLLASEEYNRYGAGTTSGGEFLPRTATWDEGPPSQRRGIRQYDRLWPQAGWQAGLVRVLAGSADVSAIAQAPNLLSAQVRATDPAEVAFHQLYFPGWRAFVDGLAVPVGPLPPDARQNVSPGFMVVAVPSGDHQVELRFGPTPIRAAATALSFAALVSLLVWGVRRRSPWLTRRVPSLFAVGLTAILAAACSVATGEVTARPVLPRGDDSQRIVADVAAVVSESRAQTLTPTGRGTGALLPHLEPRFLSIGADTRRWLFMHPPAEAALNVDVPEQAYLQAALAIDPSTWERATGDGARFIAEVEHGGRRTVILDRTVNPRARSEDRGWIDVWSSLAPFAGQRVRLVLRTEHGADPSYDWAGWGHPQVVVWRAARPHPASPHPW
ncbi:MAG TPA: 6-pyruvoyl-tetrahydropterin synthase-related protein [Chloroflexota bacterium]|nr:6-pyruvoyl-tetrahydropterin synthase-related protein [Chloroflexota bacterium]